MKEKRIRLIIFRSSFLSKKVRNLREFPKENDKYNGFEMGINILLIFYSFKKSCCRKCKRWRRKGEKR